MNSLLKRSLGILLLTAIIVIIGYYWIDVPLTYWAAAQGFNKSIPFHVLAHLPDVFFVGIFFVYLFIAIRFGLNHFGELEYKLFVIANSLAIADFLKGDLKMIFGRYWPSSWVDNNPSLLRDGVYGFNWFHAAGGAYKSFPSGHTACIVAMATVLIYFFPRWKWLWLAMVIATAVGLVGACYHFFSDLIAGAAVGYLAALFTINISEKLSGSLYH